MKKIILVISMLLLLTMTVSALTITGNSTLSMCQCETVTQQYNVCADVAGTYTVSAQGSGAQWLSIAPTTFSLNANQCKTVHVFVTPECYATSGTFTPQLVVNGTEQAQKAISVNVQQCHTFNYNVTPTTNTSNPCEENTYNIFVKNTGKFVDEFVLLQNGVEDSWVSYPRSSFVLNAGEELNTSLTLNSACSALQGSYPFSLALSNTKTNASATKSLTQIINSFTPFTHTLQTSISTCSEADSNVSFFVRNVSDSADALTFTLSAPENVSLSNETISLQPDETKEVVLFIKNGQPLSGFIGITIHSQMYNRDFNISAQLTMNDCYNLEMSRKDSATIYCLGNNSQTYVVENKGTQAMTLTVSATGITTAAQQITVPAKQSREVNMSFTQQSAGIANISIIANAGYVQDTVDYNLVFENCYGSDIVADALEVCTGKTMTKTITLKNNGTKAQEYNLSTNAPWITLSKNNVSLASNTEETIVMTLNVPQTLNDNYTLSVLSDNVSISRTMPVTILSNEVCYGFDPQRSFEAIDVNCCEGEIAELNVTNTGFFTQTINLEKIAPEWVSFSEPQITLLSGETKTVYVYFSPPAGTNGQVIATIKLTNQENVTQNIDFNLNVIGGNCGVALSADLNVDNELSNTVIHTRKEFEIEFEITNDSNVGFNVLDMNVDEYDAWFEFEKGKYLSSGDSMKVRMIVVFDEKDVPTQDANINVNILTSVGTFKKSQLIKYTGEPTGSDISINAFFAQFAAPTAGIILLIIILVIIVVVASKAKSSPKKGSKKK